MSTSKALIGSALLLAGLTGCMNSLDSTEIPDNDAQIQTYATKKNLTVQRTDKGLYYVITTPNPNGKKAQIGDEVEFMFKLYNLNDEFLDSTRKDSAVYYQFTNQYLFLPGLQDGIGLMREGEKATLLVPYNLAYGNQAVGDKLPAYSPVRFDVTFLRSRTEDEQIDEYIKRAKLTNVEKTASGLRFVKTKTVPSAAAPNTGQNLQISYSGKLLRGLAPFDSGLTDKVVGQTKFVPGFEEGLARLNVGEKAIIILPSSLAYGTAGAQNPPNSGRYVIPPYAPIVFEIELVSAR